MSTLRSDHDLTSWIKTHSSPRFPVPTEIVPKIAPLSGVETVIFDVYGTLLTSVAGEVGATELAMTAFTRTCDYLQLNHDYAQQLAESYRALIAIAHSTAREGGIDYPEVDIVAIWREVLFSNVRFARSDLDPRIVALVHEVHVNPVWLMPGFPEVTDELRRRGYRLAIVSNAQFYTPLTVEALTGRTVEELGFAPAIYSYREGVAKPSPQIFARLVAKIGAPAAASALHVGNDMLNDIACASSAGLKTVLFGGDASSLRTRNGDERVEGITPDRVILSLEELLTVLPPIATGGSV